MKNKLLDMVSKEQLIQDLKTLGTTNKISKKYNINVGTVMSAFNILGIKWKKNADIPSIFTPELLQKEYDELQSFKKIAKKYNTSSEGIRDYMNKLGLKYNPLIRYNSDHDFFSFDNQESFYLAGFIAADGCIKTKKGYEISSEVYVGLNSKDKDHLIMIKNILKSEAPVRDFIRIQSKRNPKWKDTFISEITITSHKMCEDLKRFNIGPRKSLTYIFPQWLITHSLLNHFLRGYNDGDGSFYVGKQEQIYISVRGTIPFLTDFRSILERECQLKVRTKPVRISSGHGILEYGGNKILKRIFKYLYKDATIFLPRKKQIVQHLLDSQ